MVQQRITKMVIDLDCVTCREKLKELGLFSAEKKRFRQSNTEEITDTIQVYGRRMRNNAHKLG